MRVLVSGVTREQANALERRSNFVMLHAVRPLLKSLRHQGHDVDHRRIMLGEDLRGRYDRAVIFLSPVNSFPANKCGLGALWALSQLDCPTLVYMEDWQYKATFNSLRRLSKNPQDLHKTISDGSPFFYDDPLQIKAHEDELIAVTKRLQEPWTDWFGICSMFEWGDLDVIRKTGIPCGQRLGRLEFSAETFEYMPPANELQVAIGEKETRWICASLVNHKDWVEKQNLRWPIQYFGQRRGEIVRLDTEADVALEVARSSGSLCPRYPHAGSGWFRVRYIVAALGRTVLGTNPDDTKVLGPAYAMQPYEVERLTPQQRVDLAVAQQQTIWPMLWSWDRYHHEVKELLDACAR